MSLRPVWPFSPPPKPNLSADERQAQDAGRLMKQNRPAPLDQGGTQAASQVATSRAPDDLNMEDIVASIQRILSEDEPTIQPRGGPALKAAVPETRDLTENMLVADSAQAQPPATTVATPTSPPVLQMTAPTLANPPAEPDHSLLAPATAAAAAAAVSTLLQTVAANRSSTVARNGPNIEDLVRAQLRPVLKQWLDTHLPDLVERLVRVEIERVVGRTLS